MTEPMGYFDPQCHECVSEIEDGAGPWPMAEHTGHGEVEPT